MDLQGYLVITKSNIYNERKYLQHDRHHNFDEKLAGKRSTGNPYAAFDVAGAGNVTKGVGLRTAAKAADNTPNPKGKHASSRPYPLILVGVEGLNPYLKKV